MKSGARNRPQERRIASKFDHRSYDGLSDYEIISNYAAREGRNLSEFLQCAALFYIEYLEKEKESLHERGEAQS